MYTGVCEINAQLAEIPYLVSRPPSPQYKVEGDIPGALEVPSGRLFHRAFHSPGQDSFSTLYWGEGGTETNTF